MKSMFETIKERRSVRTYDGNRLSEQHIQDIEEYVKEVKNPFDISVEFVLLNAKDHKLSSPVLSGEEMYVAGKVEKKPYADVAFGYSFEKMVLHAWELGIGTVWIGGTMNRDAFEKAAGVKEGEMMPCVSPLGYPAKKMSIKETMMRKGVGADARMSPDKLFFEDSWGKPLNITGDMSDVLEMVRWAPSAVNKQPWRIILKDGIYHFYEKKDKGYDHENTGDLQKIDVGIALCHFDKAIEEKGMQARIEINDPGIETPDNVDYIVSAIIG